jgi:hypothetical protein
LYCKRLRLELTRDVSNQQSTVVSTIKELQETNNRLEANTTEKLEGLTSQLLEILQVLDNKPPDARREDIVDVDIPGKLEALSEEGKKVIRQQEILASLRFSTIKVRHNAVKKAHADTFDWIFKSSKVKVKEWLDSGTGIYWVQGKAGSGKSTLMRYMAEHDKTKSSLQCWAGSDELSIASHFFWNAGNTMQKSQQGLLQTLLYQVLRQFPILIPTLCSVRWNGVDDDSESWSFDELFNAFDKLAKQTLISTKFCFFIDGLDEYEGNHTELTRLIKILALSSSIKLCVSSRPWNPFIRAFGESEQQLKLEDLTKDDIKNYVRSKLQENEPFRELEKQDSRCNEIVADIVQRAQGVFLWVYLVVDSLLKGLDEGDDARDLRDRLESLPDDLEDFFGHMLRTIDRSYREQTYRIFQITLQAMQPLPVLAFTFLERERENPNYALEVHAAPYPDHAMGAIHRRMKERLNARCRDLLEVNIDSSESGIFKYKVDFLHRTVRDFFVDTNALEEMLKGRIATSFNAHWSLCGIMLALTKALPEMSGKSSPNLIFSLADELMYHAWQFERGCIHRQDHSSQISMEVELLDQLDRVLTKHTESSPNWWKSVRHTKYKNPHWTNARDIPKGLEENERKTFIASAIQFKLTLYVRQKLERHPKLLHSKDGRPLLDYALRPDMVTPIQLQHLDPSPDVDMVRLLLVKGADPNQSINIYDQQTVWSLFLQLCYTTISHGNPHSSNMYGLLQVLIDGGANPNIRFKTDDKEVVTISDVLKRMLRESEITRLNELLAEKRKSRFSIWRLQGILGVGART